MNISKTYCQKEPYYWSFPLLAAKDFTTVLLSYNLMYVCILYIWSYNRTSALYFISCHVNFVCRLCLNSVLIFNVYSETLNTSESAAVRSSWCSGFRFKSAGSFHSHFYSQHVLSVKWIFWCGNLFYMCSTILTTQRRTNTVTGTPVY